jgi:hypothetical protein
MVVVLPCWRQGWVGTVPWQSQSVGLTLGVCPTSTAMKLNRLRYVCQV